MWGQGGALPPPVAGGGSWQMVPGSAPFPSLELLASGLSTVNPGQGEGGGMCDDTAPSPPSTPTLLGVGLGEGLRDSGEGLNPFPPPPYTHTPRQRAVPHP